MKFKNVLYNLINKIRQKDPMLLLQYNNDVCKLNVKTQNKINDYNYTTLHKK
jgi:hypothetical protein